LESNIFSHLVEGYISRPDRAADDQTAADRASSSLRTAVFVQVIA
jgi:hypothetical protein